MTYSNTQEAVMDAERMERHSIIGDDNCDERDMQPHKRSNYLENMYDAADQARKEAKEHGE